MGKYRRLARLHVTRRRRAAVRLAGRALRDESGGETLEYALVIGLMVTSVIGVIQCVGTKVLAKWNSINSSL